MKPFLSIVFCFLTHLLFCQINDVDAFFDGNYDKDYIKRKKIKQIIVENYINDKKNSITNFYFDKFGFLKLEVIAEINGKKINDYLFGFNKEGDLISRKNVDYETNKMYTVSYKKMYRNSKIIKETSSELPIIKEYIYNNKKEKIQEIITFNSTFKNDYLNKRIINNKYDDSGKLVEVTEILYSGTLDTLGSLLSHRFILYKGNKILIEEERVKGSSDLPVNKGTIKYLYDRRDNLISIESDRVASRFFTYYENGLLFTEKKRMPDEFSHINFYDKYSYKFF